MIPDRRTARDVAIRAVLPLVPTLGWTAEAVRQAVGPDADMMFPGGSSEMVASYIDMADRDMVAEASHTIAEQKVSRRVRTLIATRLEQAAPHKQAVRRAMTVLTLPINAPVAVRCTYDTVDAIWRAAGDASTDLSWYSKRATLAAVYASTLMYWLNADNGRDETLAFLDRRLAGVARIGRWRRDLTQTFLPLSRPC